MNEFLPRVNNNHHESMVHHHHHHHPDTTKQEEDLKDQDDLKTTTTKTIKKEEEEEQSTTTTTTAISLIRCGNSTTTTTTKNQQEQQQSTSSPARLTKKENNRQARRDQALPYTRILAPKRSSPLESQSEQKKKLNQVEFFFHGIESKSKLHRIHTERLLMAQRVPLTAQSHTNQRTNFHSGMNVLFLEHLLPEEDYEKIQLLVELNRWAAINHKSFDTLFTELLNPYNKQWQDIQQKFFRLPPERRRALLSRAIPDTPLQETERKLRAFIPPLTKYLEKRQIMELREIFPHIAEENLMMRLNQERDLERCIMSLRKQEELREQVSSSLSVVSPAPVTEEHPEEYCKICCSKTKKFAKFKNCDHHEHACISCSKAVELCPWCRKPVR